MIVLGLGFTYHEASVALVVDGTPRVAIARERLSRVKRDGCLKWGSGRLDLSQTILYCLESSGLQLRDVDLMVFSHYDHAPTSEVFTRLAAEEGLDLSLIDHFQIPHHFAHACLALHTSPFDDAAILVVDGSGGTLSGIHANCEGPEVVALDHEDVLIQTLPREQSKGVWELESFYLATSGRWQVLRKIVGDWAGIGAAYGMASKVLFGELLDAGKTMGLAPYGRAWPERLFFGDAGTPDARAFLSLRPWEHIEAAKEVRNWVLEHPGDYSSPLVADFAASIQQETEEALLAHAHWLRRQAGGIDNLCLVGGVALNSVANSRLATEVGFSNVFVPSCPGDDGIALGCALYGAVARGEFDRLSSFTPFLGKTYPSECLEVPGLERCPAEGNLLETVARLITQGAVICWYEGGAELGPRALGHRSFLADPRRPDMKDHLNLKVKNRESFRPFAPVILSEAVLEFFDVCHPSRFMSFVARVRPDKQNVIPAVTHVDGTARYQVLYREDNPRLHALVSSFAAQTGIPLLLNTSFNRAGEPLVETPLEAANCFLASSANYLCIDGILYRPALNCSMNNVVD